MPSSDGSVDVGLFFDVEDIFNPPEAGSDDSVKELAEILTREGLRGTFLFIGDRALLLRSRDRPDVLESLEPHDVGLHTRSARHPTNPEYVAGASWDEAVATSLESEGEGVGIIEEVFSKPCAALSSHNVFDSPHVYRAAALLKLPYIYGLPAAPPLFGPSWFAGALTFPFGNPTPTGEPVLSYFEFEDHDYHTDTTFQPDPAATTFEQRLRQLDERLDECVRGGQPFLTLFLFHPQRLRLVDFADPYWCPNGVNVPEDRWGTLGTPRRRSPEEVEVALRNFARLAAWLRRDPRVHVITATEAAETYGHQQATISRDQLLDEATAISGQTEILAGGPLSPAEVLVGMARAIVGSAPSGRLPDEVPRDDVLGPVRSPIWLPELPSCDGAQLVALAQELLDHVRTTGHLPATLGPPLERVGANHLYRAFAEHLLGVDAGRPPGSTRFLRTRPWPRIAPDIGISFLRAVEGELIDPDTEVNTLYRDGKLQTWTLKAATPVGSRS